MMARLLSFAAVAALLVFAVGHGVGAESMPIDQYVETFNPDFLHTEHGKMSHPMQDIFSSAADDQASDIAGEVRENTWFSFLIFVPFLVLPQILLLVAIFKFRERKNDPRKAATFIHHTGLENAWTAIPILTLLIVAFPVYPLLYKMELPPRNPDVLVTITGKQFAWDYEYKREKVAIGWDSVAGIQEPVILPKGKIVSVNITSNDVNHAWWVPAFGVKKDGIKGRFNNAWFTTKKAGVFKGQCAELCGEGHGIMLIFARVVEPNEFADWVMLQHHRVDAGKVFAVVQPAQGPFSQEALSAALDKYFEKDRSAERATALKYWVASNYASLSRRPPADMKPEGVVEQGKQRRPLIDSAIDKKVAELENVERDHVAATTTDSSSQAQE